MVVNIRQIYRHIRIYPKFLKQSIKVHKEYNIDFFMGIFASITGHLAAIFFLSILYQNVPEIAGWTRWEIIFLYGLAILSRAFASTLFQGVWSIGSLIGRGELDKFLVRPVWPLFQVLGSVFGVQGIGHLLSGGTMLIISGRNLDIAWNMRSISWLIMALLLGCLILVGVLLIAESASFWTSGQQTNLPYLAYQMGELGRYPLEAYPLPIRTLVTWVIPFAFGTYYPTAAILQKPSAHLAFLSAPIAIAILILATAIWRIGLSSYTGTGS
jgi:ABC-2 type transport system permease protein